MAPLCVGNSKLERHCSKESTEQDQDEEAACSLDEARGEHTAVMQGWVEGWKQRNNCKLKGFHGDNLQFQTRSA